MEKVGSTLARATANSVVTAASVPPTMAGRSSRTDMDSRDRYRPTNERQAIMTGRPRACPVVNDPRARQLHAKARKSPRSRQPPAGLLSRNGRSRFGSNPIGSLAVSYTHLRAHETRHDLVCRLLLE